MKRHESIDELFKAAWDLLWAKKAEDEKRGWTYRDEHRFTTATEVEDTIRYIAGCRLEGKKPLVELAGRGYGRGVRIKTGFQWPLLDVVRSMLREMVEQGKAEAFNFGKHTCTGMRYSLPGTGRTDAEKRTLKAKANRTPRPIHLRTPGSYYRRLCESSKQRAKAARSARRCIGGPRLVNDPDMVTCPRCLKRMAELRETEKVDGTMDEKALRGSKQG